MANRDPGWIVRIVGINSIKNKNTETEEIVGKEEALVASGHNTKTPPAKAILTVGTPAEAPGYAREKYRATLENWCDYRCEDGNFSTF